MNGAELGGQVLALCREEDFADKRRIRRERVRFSGAKGHTQRKVRQTETQRAKLVCIWWGLVLRRGRGGAGPADMVLTWPLCLLPVGGELGLPLFLP